MTAAKKNVRLLYVVTEDQYFYSHRRPLARAAIDAGCEVYLATQVIAHRERIEAEGIKVIPLQMQRAGRNPLHEIKTLRELYRVYRELKPDLVHHVAMKPVLYGTSMALLAGVPAIVNAIAGLGFVFISKSPLARLLRPTFTLAFRYLLNKPQVITIMQNDDDRASFAALGVRVESQVRMVRGSGVDIEKFSPTPEPSGPVTITLVARLLKHKGVVEFVEASRTLKQRGLNFRAVLVGDPDPSNPATCTEEELKEWADNGLIEWWGRRSDIPEVWRESHIAVLPSYREGLPKSLLEAAACARPMVASDVPGCRDVVRDGENGWLVPARESTGLAEALSMLIESEKQRLEMGAAARTMVENEYSDSLIATQTMAVYASLLHERWPGPTPSELPDKG